MMNMYQDLVIRTALARHAMIMEVEKKDRWTISLLPPEFSKKR